MISKLLEKAIELLLTSRTIKCSNANLSLFGFAFVELSLPHIQEISRDGREVSQIGDFVAVDADVVGASRVGLPRYQILRFASHSHACTQSEGLTTNPSPLKPQIRILLPKFQMSFPPLGRVFDRMRILPVFLQLPSQL